MAPFLLACRCTGHESDTIVPGAVKIPALSAPCHVRPSFAGRREEAHHNRLGPAADRSPGPRWQLLLILDEVPAPAPGRGHVYEVRTARLLTTRDRRYLSGAGEVLLLQTLAAARSCIEQCLLVVAGGVRRSRTFF